MIAQMGQGEIAAEIRKAARRQRLWVASEERNRNGHSERLWWFSGPGEERFAQRGLTDKETIAWLQYNDLENLGKLKLHD